MKKIILLFLMFGFMSFLILGCSLYFAYSSYPIMIKEIEKPQKDIAFHASIGCTHVLIIEVSTSLLKELGVFSEKEMEMKLPISMDIILKNKNKQIIYNEENLNFSLSYTAAYGKDGASIYGFRIPLGILEKGDYFISISSNFLTDNKEFHHLDARIMHTCKVLF